MLLVLQSFTIQLVATIEIIKYIHDILKFVINYYTYYFNTEMYYNTFLYQTL